ncbi:sensor histidine kinase [Hwangdonia lutea]|uniref:Histidine kinase n=1 Tax=Hwangdonia lutea TaxID=3075823 RepID=A0AA97HRH1_9FLAO|nr:histidine kinase [Hwangdonia sp. SCSIO 19198]WOD44040.1 histidine kinase [Hwangdonia sp. SCSIO 19198]
MKSLNVWFHIGFWVVYTAIFTIVQAGYKGEYQEALVFELINLPVRLLVVYFNYFVLLPKLLLQGRITKYFLYTVITLIIAGFVQRFVNYYALDMLYPSIPDSGIWLPYKFLQASIIIASPLIFIIGISIVWKVAQLQKRTKSLENEKLQSELKYLKSQINPHFLFNTLNNIYGLSLENSKKTSGLILKLSDFLSFSLYESNQKLIPLEKEIALMNDFIALEKSRFEDRVNVVLKLPKNEAQDISIPPLILVPFVENAFKHGLKNETEMATIKIHLSVSEKILNFRVTNSKPLDSGVTGKNKGLGLANIQKRLDIIYGKNYSLNIDEQPDVYTIHLQINTA